MFPLAWDQTAAADGLEKGEKKIKNEKRLMLRFGREDIARS